MESNGKLEIDQVLIQTKENNGDGYDVAGTRNRTGRDVHIRKGVSIDQSESSVFNDVTPTLCVAILSSVVGCALTMGYNTGVINPPQMHIQDFIQRAREKRYNSRFSDSALNWYWAGCVSCYFLTAPLGCFLGSWAVKRYGRITPMWLNNILMLIGALLQSGCSYFNSYEMFLVGRAITGINNGANTVLCPTYLAEIAPKSIRGGIGALFQLSVISGVVISFVLGLESLLGNADNWPYLFSVVIVFGLIQCLTLPFSPESPRYILFEQENWSKCVNCLKQLRPSDFDIETELVEIQDEILATRSMGVMPHWLHFITKPNLRQPLCLAIVMTISQHYSGINSLSVYSSPIIKAALPQHTVDSHPDLTNYVVISTGLVSFTFTAISVPLIDRLGRKASHLMGLFGMAVCMLFVSVLFSDLQVNDSQTCHGVNLPGWTNYVALVFLSFYVAFFGIGPAAVPWLITPELFTAAARARAVSIVTTINWLCNFSVVFGFVPLQDAICGWVFLVFFAVTSLCILFLSRKLPEVRGGDTIGKVISNFEESV